MWGHCGVQDAALHVRLHGQHIIVGMVIMAVVELFVLVVVVMVPD